MGLLICYEYKDDNQGGKFPEGRGDSGTVVGHVIRRKELPKYFNLEITN